MRLVGFSTMKEGQKLAMPIYSTSGRIILNAGVVLTDSYISKLKSFHIDKVYIHDARFDDIVVYSPLDWETKRFASLVVGDILVNFHKKIDIDEYVIKDASKKITEYVIKSQDMGVSLLNLSVTDEYIIEHSINVAILSAFIGIRLHLNYLQLVDLVAGALVHDIGRDNAPEENADHVQKAFEVLRKCRGLNLASSIISYEHHENYDGSGYVRRIKGEAISRYSRIVRVADEYDRALRGYYSNGKSLMPHQAYEILLALSAIQLDPNIVQAFRDTIVFYPNGCTVALNNGFQGVVVKQNSGSPQRPIIRSVEENESDDELDLITNMNLAIDDVFVA